jgi:two-component system LytT family response regulator
MNAVGGTAFESQGTMPSGARVVIIEPNGDVRDTLREAIDGAHTFVLSGVAHNWREGVDLIDRYVPELVILREAEVPADAVRRFTSCTFPLLVGISSAPGNTIKSVLTTLTLPLDDDSIAEMLGRARAEIYARKANELSELLDHYLHAAYLPQQYLAHFKVDHYGQSVEIATDEVVSISADGNYVRVHTPLKTYEMRETMAGLNEKLDPRSFVRVHRSRIINLRYVNDIVDRAGASLILMNDGTEIPVGPNYRDEISGSLNRRLRLTA